MFVKGLQVSMLGFSQYMILFWVIKVVLSSSRVVCDRTTDL